jgi:hypothetical protein
MAKQQDIINKINEYLPDEHADGLKYSQLINEIGEYFGEVKVLCINKEDMKILQDLTRLPKEEAEHHNILFQVRCLIEQLK